MDKQDYLHLVFEGDEETIYYATMNPDNGITESSPEPKPSLVLIPTSQGFWITGCEGEARIYDPAGRFVLGKEIKGKTLISPLSPVVYFVMAGRDRARVAVW